MAADLPSCFTNELDMYLDEFSATHLPNASSFDSPDEYGGAGFEFVPWGDADCNYQQLDFPQSPFFKHPSYSSCKVPPSSTAPPSSYLTLDSPDVDAAWNNSISPTSYPYSRPPADSPVTNSSDLGDADRWRQALPTPVKSPATSPATKKRNTAGSDPPSKRSCSQVVSTDAGPPKTAPAAKSKKEVLPSSSKSATKPKAGAKTTAKKPSDAKSGDQTLPTTFPTTSPRPPRNSSSTKPHRVQLRTSARKKTKETAGVDSAPPPPRPPHHPDRDQDLHAVAPQTYADDEQQHQARHCHNLVEKQYRNRLNRQFESLLAVLPVADNHPGGGDRKTKKARVVVVADGGGGATADGGGGGERRLSKAEVLDMARRRIVALEREYDALRSGRLGLCASGGFGGDGDGDGDRERWTVGTVVD